MAPIVVFITQSRSRQGDPGVSGTTQPPPTLLGTGAREAPWPEIAARLSAIGVQWTSEFIETSVFTRQITALLNDDEYRQFQSALAANPAAGVLIRGGGGIRKVRIAIGGRGTSGGARVIYYWAVEKDAILLVFAYAKNVAAELTAKQTVELAKLVKQEFAQ